MTVPRPLDDIQKWMQAVIVHPGGVGAGLASDEASRIFGLSPDELDSVILPSRELSSHERLQIYSRAYFGRLIECLKAQFPAVCHAVGDEAFNSFAFGYLIEHPSRSYTLSPLGDSFDAYLEAIRPIRSTDDGLEQPDFADFVIDLAKLERTYNEVFDGPGPETTGTLTLSDLAGISPKDFAECRLIVHPCARLLELRFPVHEYASAVRRGTEPNGQDPRPTKLVVTRRDYVVRRFELTDQQFDLLSALNNQMSVGEALAQCCKSLDSHLRQLPDNLQTWFHEWTSAPLFASILRPDDGPAD